MNPRGSVLTIGIVGLTLVTAYIHLTLGGLLFTLNGLGYLGLAALLVVGAVVRHPVVDRFAWLLPVALAGYTSVTILGYLVMGPHFALGWITKGVEVALIGLVAIQLVRTYGSPIGLVRAAFRSLRLERSNS